MNNTSAFKKKLDLIGKLKVKNVLLVQPIQVSEKKLDIKISLNKRYYMFPPYALGILNTILKKNNYNSSIIDLNFEVFNYVYKSFKPHWENDYVGHGGLRHGRQCEG